MQTGQITAQKQLAELNATTGHWSDATESSAAGWVDKNGKAAAGLIAAAMVLERWRIHWSELRFDPAEQMRADLATLEFRKNLVALTAAEWVESPTDKWLETEQLYRRPKLAPLPAAPERPNA